MKTNKKNRIVSYLLATLATAATLFTAPTANAVVYYWDGATNVANSQTNNATTTAQNWVSGGNWDSGTGGTSVARLATVFTASDDVVIGGTAASQTITAGTLTLRNMTFGGGTAATTATGAAYTITGGTITLASSTITTNSNITISSALAGTTGLTKAGNTYLVLSGSHTGLSGTTTINAGAITMNTASNSTAIVVNSGGQFYGGWGAPANTTFANNFTISGTGFVEGGINVSAIRASNNQTFSGTITLNAASRIGMIDATVASTFSGRITGNFALNIQGAHTGNSGTQTFTLANVGTASDYTGDLSLTTVGYGAARTGARTILRLNADNQIPNGTGRGNLILSGADANNQTIFELNGRNETINGLSNASSAGAIIRNTTTSTNSILTIGDANANGSFSGVVTDSPGTLSLTKIGSGTYTFSGVNTYTGATNINAGTLVIDSTGAIATSDLLVKNTTTLQLNASGKTLQRLTLEDGAKLNLPVTAAQTIAITNDLDFSSAPTNFTVKPTFTGTGAAGTYDLLTPSSISNIGNLGAITLDTSGLVGRVAASAGVAITGGKLVLTVGVGPASLVWDNVGGTGTGNWSVQTPADNNFKNGVTDDQFYQADTVSFTETSAGPVAIVGTVSPAAITVNSTTNYGFTGTGVIAGATGLTKSGTSTLTISNTGPNTFTGGTVLNLGTITAGSTGALGTGALTINAGTLNLNAAGAASSAPVTLNAGTLVLGAAGAFSAPPAINFGASSTGKIQLNSYNLSATSLNTNNFTGLQTIENGAVGLSTLTVSNATANSFYGVISNGAAGTLALVKSGAGTLTLGGINTYTGTTTVSAGILHLSAPSATVLGGLIMNGPDGTFVRPQQVGQFGPGVVASFPTAAGSWNRFEFFGRDQTFAGITTGNLTTQGGGVFQSSETNGAAGAIATLFLNGNTSDPSYPVGGYIYNGHLRDHGGNTAGTHPLSLVKSGSGSQTLIGNVIVYSGPTTVFGGTLVLSKTSVFRSTSVTNLGTIEINAVTGDDWIAVGNPVLSGSGTWNKTGAGRATFNNVTSLMSGQINIQDGTLRNNNNAGNWSGSTADIFIGATGILDLFADAIFVDQLTGTATSVVQNGYGVAAPAQTGSAAFFEKLVVGVAGGTSDFPGIIRNNATNATPANALGGGIDLEKVGSGEFTLSGANLYTGPTTVTGGTLTLSGGAAIVDTNNIVLANLSGATLKLNANETIGSINGGGATGGNINLQGNTLTLGGNNSASSVAGAISGASGAITKLGTGVLTLAGANNYTGTTTISAGSLVLSGTGTSNISLAATTAANITGSTTGSLTVPDTAVVLGEGTVGSLNLGSAAPGATINVNPSTVGALTVTGAATVTGVNTVNLTNAGFTPGVPFTVMTFGSNANGFDDTNFQIANASSFRGATFVVNPTNVTLEMASLNLTWNNSDGANAGKWDFNNATNFYDAVNSANEVSVWGDFFTFNDAAAPNGPAGVAQVISVIGAQQPASMTVTGATDYTFNLGAGGTINGSTSLVKSGSGTLTMNLPNGYTGGTSITDGVLTSTAAGSLGTGLITLSNGTLNANVATALGTAPVTVTGGTLNANVATALGTAPVTVTGGTLNATVTNALGAGNIALNGGTLIPANVVTPFGTATVAFGGGTLQYLATGTTTDISANLKNSISAMRIDTNGNSATFGTALPATNTGGLTKLGTGNLTLGVAQAYLGGTDIQEGSITVGGNFFPTTGTVVVGASGTAILNSTAGADTTYTTVFSGSGLIKLNMSVTGVFNSFLSGASTGFTGTLELSATNGGKLAHTATAGQTLNISPLALIKINSGASFYQTISIANPMQLIGTGNTENRGALRLGGGIVSGNLSLLGNTTIGHEGTPTLSGNISGGAASAMTLTMGTTNSTAGTNMSGNITNGLATSLAITFLNGNNTLGGTNAFTGGLTLTAGTLTVNGSNAAGAGNTTITAGTLNLNAGITGSGTLTMATGTTLTGEGSAPNITTLGTLNLTTNPGTTGALSTAGTLNIGGLTTVTVTGGAFPGGPIKVLEFGTAGTGLIAGNFALANGASYRPGTSFAINANDVSVNLANATLEWNNAGANLAWNTNITANFRDTTSLLNDKFFFGDNVIFGDLPGAAQTIAISGSQQASSVTVNSQYNYTFNTGSITGGGVLTKTGTGILQINTASVLGDVVIKQGEFRSGNGSAAGTLGTITLNDATTGAIDTAFLATAAQTIVKPIVVANQGSGVVKLGSVIGTGGLISYNGTVTLNRATTLVGSSDRTTFNGKISGNVGTLTIDGTAGHRVTIGVGNDFVGNVVVNNGVLFQSDSPTSLPSATNMTLLGTSNYRLNGGGTHTINSLNAANPGSNVNIIAGGVSTLSLGNNNGSGIFNGAVINNTAALSLIKNGSGTQSLLGANTYTGTTTINAGTLELAPVATYGAITVADSAVLSIVGSSTAQLRTTTMTLGTAGATTLNINNFGSSLTLAPLQVTGALTANGTITANVSGSFTVGTYPLISYATGSLGGAGFAAFTLGTLPNGTSATLVNNTANKSIDLVVTAAGSLAWDGTIDSQWDVNTTANWLNPAAANYVNADVVLFNDAATGSTNVVLNAAVTPASVAFNNTSKTYTLSGTGSIGGVAPITKTGTGLTTLTTANTSTGLVTISAGTLQLGDGTTNGSVAGNIANTANLIFNNATAQSYAGNITGFLGTVTKTGAGKLTLTGINTYTGGTTVSNGILQLGDGAQNGTVGTGTYSLAGGTSLFLNYATAIRTTNFISFGITGAGTIELNSAQPVNGSANWGPDSGTATPLNPAFTGTLQIDRGRFDSSAVGMGGTTNVIIKDGAQFLGWSGASYPQAFSIEGAGWGEGGQLGSLRAGGGQVCVFNGNITLTNNASFNAQDTGTVMTLNGVIGGTGNLTRYNGGRINFYGSSSNTWTGGLILNSTSAVFGSTTLFLGKTGGALAVPANTPITFGNGISGESNLRMEQSNQFGSGVVINFVNPTGGGNWCRFDMRGTQQTLAGINSGTALTQGSGIVQNRAVGDTTSTHGIATLTLNGSGNYLFNGDFRDVDSGSVSGNILDLVKTGSGTQTFAGNLIAHTGNNTISGGTLVLPTRVTDYGDTTVTGAGTKLGITGSSGSVFFAQNLTFDSGTKLSVRNFANNTSTNCLNIINLTVNGPVTVDIPTMPTGTGPYPILTYGNGYAGTDFVLDASGWTLPRAFSSPALVNDTANSVINLTANYNPLIWVGTSNIWDLTTQNWTIAGNPADYDENDVVQFDESGTAINPNVLLNTAIAPNTVNFMNTIIPYSLSGTGGIGGTAAINKSGAGTVVIKNANPTSGLTTLTQGILQLGDGTLNGSVGGNIALAGATAPDATLVLNPATSQTLANIISGSATSGTISKIGTGTAILTGVNTYLGATTITDGTLQLGDGTIQPTIPSTYAITAPGTLKIQYNTAAGAVAQTWSKFTGNGTLALATGKNNDAGWGNGTLANTFTGTLRIEGGRVALAAVTGAGTNFGLGGTTKVIITSGGHLGMWENGITLPSTMAFEIAGTGYGEANYEEAIRMGNGSSTSTINGTVLLTASAAVGAQGAGTGIIAGVISGGVGANLTIGALTGTQQTGTIGLSGANTYAGDTIINMGTLRIDAAGAIPDGAGKGNLNIGVVSSTATFSLNGFSETINGLTGSGIITAGTGSPTLTVGNNDQSSTYSGTINNTGTLSLNKIGTGTLTLSGPLAGSPLVPTSNSSFSGNITVTTGKLIGAAVRTGNNTVFGLASNTRTITVESGAFLEFHATNTFGGHNTINVPTLVVNGGTVTNADPLVTNRINNGLRNVTLNSGSLLATVGNGTSDIDPVLRPGEGYGAWGLNGTVTSTGTSLISTGSLTGKAGRILLSSSTADTNFNVTSGTLTVAAPLQTGESTPNYGMTKTGLGTLVLSADNVHSTPTLVSAGTLHLTGSMIKPSPLIAASAITVGSTGTLTGTGTAEGTVTVQAGGFVNPGTAGTTGTLNVGASTLSGTYTCDIDGASADRINVTGALTASGTPSLVFNTVSAPTLPSYIIATYSTGSVPVIPTITGIPAGYVIDTATVGEIKLVASPYFSWAASKGLTGANNGLAQDPENDGINNLAEFYFDGNPLANDQAVLPQSSLDATHLKLTFKRRDDAEAEIISQIAQWGSNLTGWTPATITAATAAADGNGVIITVGENGTAADDVEVKIPRANAVNGVLFGRVLITE